MAEVSAQNVGETVVLVVDDVSSSRVVIVSMLSSQGFKEIHQAGSVKDALQLIDTNKINLIVSDVHLLDGSVLEIIKKTKTFSPDKAPKFVVVTSDTEIATFGEVLRHGVTSYLVKPFNSSAFREAVMLSLTNPALDLIAE